MDDDVDRIMRIMNTAFDPVWAEAWNRAQISASLLMPNIHYRLLCNPAEAEDETQTPAGFTLVRQAAGEEELLLIAVDPSHRNGGIGSLLIEQITDDARSRGADYLFLEMRANNPAERLYRKFGFEPIGRRANYYRGPGEQRIDAITFRLTL